MATDGLQDAYGETTRPRALWGERLRLAKQAGWRRPEMSDLKSMRRFAEEVPLRGCKSCTRRPIMLFCWSIGRVPKRGAGVLKTSNGLRASGE